MRPPLTVPDALPEDRAARRRNRACSQADSRDSHGAWRRSTARSEQAPSSRRPRPLRRPVAGGGARPRARRGGLRHPRVGALHHEPLFPKLMLARTPVSGLVVDGFYAARWGGRSRDRARILFAGAVTGWVAVARQWGRKPAVAMFVLLAVVPAFGLFFHRVSSDPVFAAILALVAYLAVRLGTTSDGRRRAGPRCRRRPADPDEALGQPYLVLALLPLGLALPWRRRVGLSLTVAIAGACPRRRLGGGEPGALRRARRSPTGARAAFPSTGCS